MRWWDSRLICEPTTSADAVIVKRSPTVAETDLVYTAAIALSEDCHTTEASAEAVVSWIGRLFHHRMAPCELWDAQATARRPHRCVQSLGCALAQPSQRVGSRERSRQRPLHDHGGGGGGLLMDQTTDPPPHDTV